MLGVLLALAVAQLDAEALCDRTRCPRARESRPDSARRAAFFEFAPASGAGMTAACACTTPTGSRGETITITRASSGTCLKGNTSSSIANGDLVTCSTNQARVMPGGDGTGALGLLVEGARTNDFLRSEEFNNAAWSASGGGFTPTVTADQAIAPDGTTTADQVVLVGTAAGQRSVLYQVAGFNGTGSLSVFVRGTATTPTGTIDVCVTTSLCTACAFVQGSWSLCRSQGGTIVSGGTTPFIGNDTADNGGTARPGQTVYLWGAQFESGNFSSSYIATTSAGVTRAADFPSAAAPAIAPMETRGCTAATIVLEENAPVGGGISAFNGGQRLLAIGIGGGATGRVGIYDSTTIVLAAVGSNFNLPHRVRSSWSGSLMSVFNVTDGLSATGAFDGTMLGASSQLEIGANTGGSGPLWGVIKQLQADPDPGICR